MEYIGNGKYSDGQKWFEMDELDFDLDDYDLRQESAGELEMIGKRVAAGLGNSFLDYWTRLEHQAAIAAMQGMMNNSYLAGEFRKDPNNGIEDMSKIITKAAAVYAHALVEKMKEVNNG